MKKLYKYIVLVIGIVAFSACADDISFPSVVIDEGKDVTLKLKVQTQANKVVESRADALDKENQLFDLHFYVFNSKGDLTGYTQASTEDMAASPGPEEVIINAKSGANSTIYALANINESNTYYLDDDQISLLTDPFNENNLLTKGQLLSMRFNRRSASAGENYSPTPTDSVFMMSGYLNDGNPVNIDRNGSVSGSDNIIKLYRLLAKNELTIRTTGIEEIIEEGTKNRKKYGQFIPRSYRFHNVPTGGMLVPNANITTANGENDIYTGVSGYHTLNKDSVECNYMLQTNDSTLTFYFPENLQTTKTGIDVWKNREANNYDTGKKAFNYAPAYAGYIEIQGDYVGKIEEKLVSEADSEYEIVGDITADVTYTIHLGNFSNNKIESDVKYGDYNVVRNNLYKYNVSVNGVNDIIAEAVVEGANDKDDNPYAEGLVINAIGSTHLNVDAHYEARVMTFKRTVIDQVKNANGQAGYFINIETPFWKTPKTYNVRNDGVYDGNSRVCTIKDAESYFNGLGKAPDFEWVKFVRNNGNKNLPEYAASKADAIKKYPCKYPGDNNEKAEAYGGAWINVFELLAQLYNTNIENTDCVYKTQVPVIDPVTRKQKLDDKGNPVFDYEAYYTCFIDENYYPKRAWTEYVNQSPRTMLIANKLDVSEDGKSLYAKVEYGISQRSIATFYLKSNSVAFGTEIYSEEKIFNQRLGTKGTSNSNQEAHYQYYENMDFKSPRNARWGDWDAWKRNSYTNSKLNWYNHEQIEDGELAVNIADTAGMQPLYLAAAKACMSRNRDLNGDGIINGDTNGDGIISGEGEGDEVRWYLADVVQYRALVFAQNVLPVDSRLISIQDLEDINTASGSWVGDDNGHNARGYYHYWTSSSGNGATFWPEEGVTNNPARPSWGVSRAELVRCVRSLESGTNSVPSYGLREPQLYYTHLPKNTTVNDTIVMDGIKVNRGYFEGSFEEHNEISELNEFYNRFVVAQNDMSSRDYVNSDPCLNYNTEGDYKWRMPNQKEFAIMVSVIDGLDSGNYGTRTDFTGSTLYNWHDGIGIFCSDGSIKIARPNQNQNRAKIRCVRDIK